MERPALLYNSPIDDPAPWKKAFAERRPDLDFRVWPDIGDATHIRYALIWSIESGFLDSLPNLEAIFSMGAGVDQICATAIPEANPAVPDGRCRPQGADERIRHLRRAALAPADGPL